jgi:ATP/maltotriose-dependent transcriptional regulator MalT
LVKVHALTNIGTALLIKGDITGEAMLNESLELSQQHGMHEETARVYTNYSDYCVRFKCLSLADTLTAKGIQYDASHDLDSWTYYLVGIQAQLRLEQGRLVEAETIAAGVQKLENQTLLMKLPALIVLARVRSRMAIIDADCLLQKALTDALATEENQYIIPARLGIIEHTWLTDDDQRAAEHIDALWNLGPSILNTWQLGELVTWACRLNLPIAQSMQLAIKNHEIPDPYQHELQGDIQAAQTSWLSLGMPFNAALVLLQTKNKNRPSAFATASPTLESMQAKAILSKLKKVATKEGFIEQIPKSKRGPYSKTRQHPAGLTSKEQAVIKLLAAGVSNQDIASALSRSQRTIENHVSSILSKLNVENRIEAMLRVQNEPWLVS